MALNWVQPDPQQADGSPLALPSRSLPELIYVYTYLYAHQSAC